MKITPPEGYEIDEENSTFWCIKFKPIKKDLTYKDVCDTTIKGSFYYINNWGSISFIGKNDIHTKNIDKNNATSKIQLQKVLAINQLFNIAKYYNGDWEPNNLNEDYGNQYIIEYIRGKYKSIGCSAARCGMPAFKNVKVADAVINNPNFRDILDAIFKS